jgi:PPP family 3-phenylpropionic acid transporter
MPYWRLSGFYLFYFAVLGALVPYWGLYLQSVGFSAADIGNLMSLLMFTRIVAPNVWAYVADHRESRLQVVRWTSFLTAVALAGVFGGTGFWRLAFVMVTFSFFWHASLPVLEVLVMNHTANRPGAYGRVRLWGSIGFILAVAGIGPLIDLSSPWVVLPSLALLAVGAWLASLTIPESKVFSQHEASDSLWKILRRPEMVAFFIASFLMQTSHGPYYTFYSIFLESFGYPKTVIGLLWAFGVLCEIGIFLAMPRLLRHVTLRVILLGSFLLAAVRWLVIGFFPENASMLVFAQVLHAATFGTFHAAGMQTVYRFFTGKHQHRGNAIYSTLSFGLGGALGSLVSGHAWETLGPQTTYVLAAGCATVAWLVGMFWFKPKAS